MNYESDEELHIPVEVVGIVLWWLRNDKATLFKCLMVCRAWAEEAKRAIWWNPPVSELANLTYERRREYTRYVQRLEFTPRDRNHHHQFRRLYFPKLEHFRASHPSPGSGGALPFGQYMQNKLKSFEMVGVGRTQEDILDTLVAKCKRLEHIEIGFQLSHRLSHQRLEEFFRRKSRSLKSIKFTHILGIDNGLGVDLFRYLAFHNGLERLDIGGFMHYTLIRPIVDMPEPIFASLRCLSVHLETRSLPRLTGRMMNVPTFTELNVTLDVDNTNPFPYLNQLTNLTVLRTIPITGGSWAAEDFMGLQDLRKLRVFKLSTIVAPILVTRYSDFNFIDSFGQKPDLEDLIFEVNCPLTTLTLNFLGRHCPRLQRCYLPIQIFEEVYAIWKRVKAPLFPRLTQLEIGGLSYGVSL